VTFARAKPEPRHPESPADVRERAVLALVASKSITAAADCVGVNERTLRRWLDEDDFAEKVRNARTQMLAQAATRIVAATTAAADTLEEIASNAEAPPAARVQAAAKILENARGFVELQDLSAKLDKLERDHAAQAMKSAMNNAAPPQKAK
jgi:hypothetical protein